MYTADNVPELALLAGLCLIAPNHLPFGEVTMSTALQPEQTRRKRTGQASAYRALLRLQRLLTLADVTLGDPADVEWSELDDGVEIDPTCDVEMPLLLVTMDTYRDIVADFEAALPEIIAALKQR